MKDVTVDPSLLTELSPRVEAEGDVRWLAIGMDGARLDSWDVPDRWRSALCAHGSTAQRITALWSGLELLLPRTVAAYSSKAHGLALLQTRQHGASLAYVFDYEGRSLVQRGFRPVQTLPAEASRFPVDLTSFYRLHDGVVDFWSYDDGLLPVAEWRTLNDPDTGEQGMVWVASFGPVGFGFDVSETPVKALEVTPDEEEPVEIVEDPWEHLDNWFASWVEDL